REERVREDRADQERPAGAERHQRAGTEVEQLGLEREAPLLERVAGDLERGRVALLEPLEVAADRADGRDERGDAEQAHRAVALVAATGAMDRAQRLGGRRARRERERLLVDQLALDRNRRE